MEQVLAMTEEMLESARAGLWERLVSLQGKRDQQLRLAFAVPAPPEAQPMLIAALEKTLSLNRQITLLVKVERDHHRERIGQLRIGQRAVRLYHQQLEGPRFS